MKKRRSGWTLRKKSQQSLSFIHTGLRCFWITHGLLAALLRFITTSARTRVTWLSLEGWLCSLNSSTQHNLRNSLCFRWSTFASLWLNSWLKSAAWDGGKLPARKAIEFRVWNAVSDCWKKIKSSMLWRKPSSKMKSTKTSKSNWQMPLKTISPHPEIKTDPETTPGQEIESLN